MTKEEFLNAARENPEWLRAAAAERRHQTNYQPDFDIDLLSGDIGEDTLGSFLRTKFSKIEVKNDVRALQTGNIAVEYARGDGQPSGIVTTKADLYAYIFGKIALLIPRDVLYLTAGKWGETKCTKDGVRLKVLPIQQLILKQRNGEDYD
jgi:hypothetical protein